MGLVARILFLSFILSLLCVSQVSAYALQLNSQRWSSDKYYQGDGGTVTISLYNDVSISQWYVKTLEIQFDWQVQSNDVYSTQVGEDIPLGHSSIYSVSFDVPPTVSVGSHSYTIYYVGTHNETNLLVTSSIDVHDMDEKQYDALLSTIQNQLNNSTSSNHSPVARSNLSQALSYFVQATTLASQHQFNAAVNRLIATQIMINHASSAEQDYTSRSYNSGVYPSSNDSCSNLSLILLILIPVALAGVVISFWKLRKSKPQNQPKLDIFATPSVVEEKRRDAIQIASHEDTKVENINPSSIEEKPKIETNPEASEVVKALKNNKVKKTKKEIKRDQNARDILKKRLAKGKITKSEYDDLRKEFE